MNSEQINEPRSEDRREPPGTNGAGRSGAASENANRRQRESQAAELVKVVQTAEGEGGRLFHDGDEGYAVVPVSDHVETHALRSRGFRRWLSFKFFKATGRMP